MRALTVWMLRNDTRPVAPRTSVPFRRTGFRGHLIFERGARLLEALEAASPRPDIILVDLCLPSRTGLRILPDIATLAPEVPVVVQAPLEEGSMLLEAFKMGAAGFLSKRATPEDVRTTVWQVARGKVVMPRAVAAHVVGRLGKAEAPAPNYGLSERECEVLRLMTEGGSRREIADRLHRSRHTIDSHVQQIYAKLRVNSATEAVAKAVRERLV